MDDFWFLKINGNIPEKRAIELGSSVWIANELGQFSNSLLDSLNNFTYIIGNHLYCFEKEAHDSQTSALISPVKEDISEYSSKQKESLSRNDLESNIIQTPNLKNKNIASSVESSNIKIHKSNSDKHNLTVEKEKEISKLSASTPKKSGDACNMTFLEGNTLNTKNKDECKTKNIEKTLEIKYKEDTMGYSKIKIIKNHSESEIFVTERNSSEPQNCINYNLSVDRKSVESEKNEKKNSTILINEEFDCDIRDRKVLEIRRIDQNYEVDSENLRNCSLPPRESRIAKNNEINNNQTMTLETVYLEDEEEKKIDEKIDKDIISSFVKEKEKQNLQVSRLSRDDSKNSNEFAIGNLSIEQLFKKNINKDSSKDAQKANFCELEVKETLSSGLSLNSKKNKKIMKDNDQRTFDTMNKICLITNDEEKSFKVLKDPESPTEKKIIVQHSNQRPQKQEISKTNIRYPFAEKNPNVTSLNKNLSADHKNNLKPNKLYNQKSTVEDRINSFSKKKYSFNTQIKMTNKFERKLGLNKLEMLKVEKQKQSTRGFQEAKFRNSNIIKKNPINRKPNRSQSLLNTETLINLKKKLNKTEVYSSYPKSYAKSAFNSQVLTKKKSSFFNMDSASIVNDELSSHARKTKEEKTQVKASFKISKISLESLKRSFSTVNNVLQYSESQDKGQKLDEKLGIQKRPTRLNKTVTSGNSSKVNDHAFKSKKQCSIDKFSKNNSCKSVKTQLANELLSFSEEDDSAGNCSLKISHNSKDWTELGNLREALRMQKTMNPYEIFGPIKSLNLSQIFPYQRNYC